MERRTHPQRAQARAQQAPGPDLAVWLLAAVVLVFIALALGTGLSLLLPAAV
jgi:hypothetical protein